MEWQMELFISSNSNDKVNLEGCLGGMLVNKQHIS